MSPISILLLGLAMSSDAFAAALGKGAAMTRPTLLQALRVGLIFGVVEALTPIVGWLIGSAASRYIQAWDHWIAFLLLGALGLHMIWKALAEDEEQAAGDSGAGNVFTLALTGLATSIDAMAAGVSLAFVQAPILVVAAVIGACTLAMVTLGVMAGRALGAMIGRRAELLGGRDSDPGRRGDPVRAPSWRGRRLR